MNIQSVAEDLFALKRTRSPVSAGFNRAHWTAKAAKQDSRQQGLKIQKDGIVSCS